MAYVHKIINSEEKLIGIARLHWIYILKGVGWFFSFAAAGWLFDMLVTRGLMALSNMSSGRVFLAPIMNLSSGAMLFMMLAGFAVFLSFVIKVISTEIALLDRRVIHKSGLIFVNVKQIDLEEIRGENLDLGWFGRFLGYGYIMLDCRFIGDVMLPAIDNPERFIRALHYERAHAQDALHLVVGKSNAWHPVDVEQAGDQQGQQEKNEGEQKPEVAPPAPAPEVSPPQPDQIPAPPNEPQPDPGQQPLGEKETEEKAPAEQQPVQAIPQTPEQVQQAALIQQQAIMAVQKIEDKAQDNAAPGKAPVVDAATVAEVIKQVTPQIAQQVVQQMEEKGLLNHNDNPPAEDKVDNDLINVFDEAALDKDGKPNDMQDKLEYAIH